MLLRALALGLAVTAFGCETTAPPLPSIGPPDVTSAELGELTTEFEELNALHEGARRWRCGTLTLDEKIERQKWRTDK